MKLKFNQTYIYIQKMLFSFSQVLSEKITKTYIKKKS